MIFVGTALEAATETLVYESAEDGSTPFEIDGDAPDEVLAYNHQRINPGYWQKVDHQQEFPCLARHPDKPNDSGWTDWDQGYENAKKDILLLEGRQ